MTIAKPLAVWQNILLAVPIGMIGGALAAAIIVGVLSVFNVADYSGAFPWSVAEVGGIIGLATFPPAYATLGRTKRLFSVVPAGLVATVLGASSAFGLLPALEQWPTCVKSIGDADLSLYLLSLNH